MSKFSSIVLDSRNVEKGSLFVAIKGEKLNGEDFIEAAIAKGAAAILLDKKSESKIVKNSAVEYIFADDVKQKLSRVCAEFYQPKPENLIAVTGTNGKTSIANFASEILYKMGVASASIGTLGVRIPGVDNSIKESLTTPDIVTFHKILSQIKSQKIDDVAFEASSHGLHQDRIGGVEIKVAGFTNLTQDHLDYHKTMEEYFHAKLLLFTKYLSKTGVAVVNADDEYGVRIIAELKKQNIKTITYGKNSKDIELIEFIPNIAGQIIKLNIFGKYFEIPTHLIGGFQSYNLLCTIGMLVALGYESEKIIAACANQNSVKGRMEIVAHTKNNSSIVIDYAHTPDALEKAILALQPHKQNRVITLFGCGGDRDKTKRPIMGAIAAKFSDLVIVTDDNPRTEDAKTIRSEIISACPNAIEVEGRRNAIERAISMLQPNDILLLAGKGHETYQIIGTEKNHFDESEIVNEVLSGN
jgi:UDP-N-acetylmuramoyl-L-alanyl-D-glutamate--2,6-diaminopimelate ligase